MKEKTIKIITFKLNLSRFHGERKLCCYNAFTAAVIPTIHLLKAPLRQKQIITDK